MAAPIKEVLYIVPSYLTDALKQNLQCAHIVQTSTELFSAPLETGLESLRLGPKHINQLCHTCLNPLMPGGCTIGHEGIITVPCYLNYPSAVPLAHFLNIICFHCHKFNAEAHKVSDCLKTFYINYKIDGNTTMFGELKKAFKPILEKRSLSMCTNCGAPIKHFSFDKNIKNLMSVKIGDDQPTQLLGPLELAELRDTIFKSPLLNKLPSEFFHFVNESFHETIFVLPNPLRPEIINHTNKIQTHPFTSGLQAIMGFKNKLNQSEIYDANSTERNNVIMEYFNAIFQYMYGKLQSSPSAPQDPNIQYIGSLTSLGTRKGIIRKNIEGRIANYTGRGVVVADSTLHPLDFQVTAKFAMNFMITTLVNVINIDRLRSYLKNGPNKWCGAKQAYIDNVWYGQSDIIERGTELAELLRPNGQDYVVHHLEDGHPGLVNRNPSLLPTNVAGGFIRVNDQIASIHSGIGMADNKLKHGYGGDADGDTVLVQIPLSPAGIMDVVNLLSLERIGRSEKNEKMIYMCTNNAVVGVITGTLNEYHCHLNHAIAIINNTSLIPKVKSMYIKKLLTRFSVTDNIPIRALLSLPLPSNLNYTSRCTYAIDVLMPYFKEGPPVLTIKNGQILKGTLMDNDAVDCNKPHTIGERLFGCISTHTIIDIFHELRQISYGILEFVGFSLSTEDLELPLKVLEYLDMYEHACLTIAKARLDIHDIITPPETSSKKLTRREAIVVQTMASEPMLGIIVNNLKGGLNNPVLTLSMTKRAHTGDVLNLKNKEGIILINGRLPEHGVPYRISPLYPAHSNDPRMIGYNGSGTQRGIDILDYFKSTGDSQNNLQQRAFQTSESGNMRRRNTYMASPAITTMLGHLVFGDLKLKQNLIGTTYGYTNLDPHMVKCIGTFLVDLLKVPLTTVREWFFLKEVQFPEIFNEYVYLRTLIGESFYNLGKTGCIDLNCFGRMRLPINIEHMHSVTIQFPHTKKDPPLIEKYGMVIHLVNRLRTAILNPDWVDKYKICPGYIEMSMIPLRLHVLHHLTPIWTNTVSYETVRLYCTMIWEQTHRAIIPGYFAAGDLAASTISEQIIQTVLDAPKSKSNVSAIQFSDYKNYAMRRQLPGTSTIAFIPIIEPHRFPNGAKHLVCVYLSDLRQRDIVEVGLAPNKTKFFGPEISEYLLANPSFLIIEFVIDRDRLTATNCGASEYYILAHIIKTTKLFCVIGERTLKSVSILIVGDHSLNTPYLDVVALRYIDEVINKITISGIEHILNAQIVTRRILEPAEDDSFVATDQMVLQVTTTGLGPLLKIKGIDHTRITFQNPYMHASYFGILPLRRKLPWMITALFPEQNVATGQILSDIMLYKGEHCPLTEHYAKHLWGSNKFVRSIIFDAKTNLTTMGLYTKKINIDDRMSRLFNGMVSKTGSNSGYVQVDL